MIVVCPGCKNQITMDDATLPSGIFKVRCTSCGKTINAQKKEQPPISTSKPPESSSERGTEVDIPEKKQIGAGSSRETSRISPVLEEYVAAQISIAKREILDAIQTLFRGGSIAANGRFEDSNYAKRALICGADPTIAGNLLSAVKAMGYDAETCSTTAEGLKSVDGQYGLIVIDPSFPEDLEGAKKIIGRINGKKGAQRRQTFVVLVSSTYKTMDGNSAFMNGVNLIVNKTDIERLDSLLQKSHAHFQRMYAAFRSVADRPKSL